MRPHRAALAHDERHHAQHRQPGQALDLGQAAKPGIEELDCDRKDHADHERGHEGDRDQKLFLRIERATRRSGRRDDARILALDGAVLDLGLLVAGEQGLVELLGGLKLRFQQIERHLGVVLLLDLLLQPRDFRLEGRFCRAGEVHLVLELGCDLVDLAAQLGAHVGQFGPRQRHLRMAFAELSLHLRDLALGLDLLQPQRLNQAGR